MGNFQATIAARPDALGHPGSRAGDNHAPAMSRINARTNQAKVVESNITNQNATAYTFTAGGVIITFTSDASGIASEIVAGLEAARLVAALANGPNSGPAKIVLSNPSGQVLRITETDPASGEVVLAEADANLSAFTVTVAHGQEEPMDAGLFVVQDGVDGARCTFPRLVGDKILGIVEHRHEPSELELSTLLTTTKLYKAFSQIPVLYQGDVVVVPENTGLITDGVYCRYASGAGGTVLGAVRATDTDTTTAVLVAGAEWVTKPVAGQKCILRLNRP